jgi:hypothetical protein
LLADNDSSQRAAGGSGIRLRLLRKPANGFRYGLALSQFSGGFHPYDSIVVAGERRATVHLGYRPWSGTQMTTAADYILRDWDGDVPCDNYRTGLSLSTTVFNFLRAKLETSAQRALDCAAVSDSGNIDIGLGLLCYVACRPTRSFAAILKPLSGGKIIRQQRLVMT